MAESQAAEIFRHNLRFVVEERGLTITQLADLSGTNRPEMSRILSGKVGLTLTRAERISNALGMPLVALLAKKFRT